jgi:hypothetical protein
MSPATFRAIVVTTLAVHIVGAILSAVDSVRYVCKTLPRTGPPVRKSAQPIAIVLPLCTLCTLCTSFGIV